MFRVGEGEERMQVNAFAWEFFIMKVIGFLVEDKDSVLALETLGVTVIVV